MMYKVVRQVTINVEADSRDKAIQHSKGWQGESSSVSFEGYLDWNCVSRFISARRDKVRERLNEKENQKDE